MRRPFYRHGPAAKIVDRKNFFLGKPQRADHIELGIVELGVGEAEGVPAEVLTQRPFIKGELNFKDLIQRRFQAIEHFRRKPFGTERFVIQERSLFQCSGSRGIGDDVVDLFLGIPQFL